MSTSNSHGGCETILTTTARTLIHTIMAITNKEIIEGQLRRINEKAHLQLVLKRANRHWYLCRECNGYELPPSPLNESFTRRTSAEMIEYLRGVEDAVDFFTHNGTK